MFFLFVRPSVKRKNANRPQTANFNGGTAPLCALGQLKYSICGRARSFLLCLQQ